MSATATAADWNYNSADDLPFAGTRQSNQPSLNLRFGTGDTTPRISIDNQKSYDATGNLSIDNDLQQDFERCQRIRSQLRSKDASKLNC